MHTVSNDAPSEGLSTSNKVKVLAAVAAQGDEGQLRAALKMVDASPCPGCDYIRSGCRCPKDE